MSQPLITTCLSNNRAVFCLREEANILYKQVQRYLKVWKDISQLKVLKEKTDTDRSCQKIV